GGRPGSYSATGEKPKRKLCGRSPAKTRCGPGPQKRMKGRKRRCVKDYIAVANSSLAWFITYGIGQGSDTIDGNIYFVAFGEGELVAGDQAGARHQKTTIGKIHIAVQPGSQLGQFAFDLADRHFTGIDAFSTPVDHHADLSHRRYRCGRN